MEKILITGANGYLGACIYSNLSNTNTVEKLQGRLEEIKPKSIDCDIVIHSAAALRHRTGKHQKSNAEGTRKLLKGLKKKTKIVYISSGSVYGKGLEGVFSEQSPVHPFDDYAKTKYEGELAVLESGFPYIIIRAGALFGLGHNNPGITFPSLAMQRLYHGHNINLFTPDVMHEYLYVWDLVSIIEQLMIKPDSWNKTFNATGPRRSLHQLINTIVNNLKKYNIKIGKVNMIDKNPTPGFFLDNTFLEETIGKINYTADTVIIKKLGDFIQIKGIHDNQVS